MAEQDDSYMRRALTLAGRAPSTSPNPRVGAVLVRHGQIISEGWHEGAGTAHAEARALESVDAKGATLYVNLEPCAHTGRTPPCAPAIAAAGVERVVIGHTDPDPRVSGRGVAILEEAGVEVVSGVLADEAVALDAAYFHHRTTGRVFVHLKLALSIDGRLAAADGSSRWISSPEARARVHLARAGADGVLVGIGTVLADDPSLDVRDVEGARQPVKIVVDSSGRTPASARLFDGPGDVLIATTERTPHETCTLWKERGAEVLVLPDDDGRVDLEALLEALYRTGMMTVFCEGGARIGASLLSSGRVHRLEVHHGPLLLGAGPTVGPLGVGSIDQAPRWEVTSSEVLGDTVCTTYRRSA